MAKKTKVIVRKIYPKVDIEEKKIGREKEEVAKVKEEVKNLEAKRSSVNTGSKFKNFIQKAAINKQINDKNAYLRNRDKLRNINKATEVNRARTEFEKSQIELNQVKKQTQVSYDDLFKGPTSNTANKVKFENL